MLLLTILIIRLRQGCAASPVPPSACDGVGRSFDLFAGRRVSAYIIWDGSPQPRPPVLWTWYLSSLRWPARLSLALQSFGHGIRQACDGGRDFGEPIYCQAHEKS